MLLNHNLFEINKSIVISSELNGLDFSQLSGFCQMLNIPIFSHQTYDNTIKEISFIVEKILDQELSDTLEDENSENSLQIQIDGQYSRPQRFTYGIAPFCTSTAINTKNGLITSIAHINSEMEDEDNSIKSKSKISQRMVLRNLKKKISTNLIDITIDNSTSSKRDIDLILKKK